MGLRRGSARLGACGWPRVGAAGAIGGPRGSSLAGLVGPGRCRRWRCLRCARARVPLTLEAAACARVAYVGVACARPGQSGPAALRRQRPLRPPRPPSPGAESRRTQR